MTERSRLRAFLTRWHLLVRNPDDEYKYSWSLHATETGDKRRLDGPSGLVAHFTFTKRKAEEKNEDESCENRSSKRPC